MLESIIMVQLPLYQLAPFLMYVCVLWEVSWREKKGITQSTYS